LLLLCWFLQPWFPSSFFPPGFRIQLAEQALLRAGPAAMMPAHGRR
jgi:hypothetical protein